MNTVQVAGLSALTYEERDRLRLGLLRLRAAEPSSPRNELRLETARECRRLNAVEAAGNLARAIEALARMCTMSVPVALERLGLTK